MRKKRRSKKVNKTKLALLLFVVVIVLLVAASYLNQPSQPQSIEKKPAEEYFRIFDATIDDGEPRFNDEGEIIAVVIYRMRFKIEAVGGDAHNVIIWSDMPQAEPEDLVNMEKGENKTAVFETYASRPVGYLSERNDEGKYPFPIRIRSEEAEGEIVIPL